MLLHQKIQEDAKTAMMKRDDLRLDVLRGLKAVFTNEMIAKGVKDEYLPDDVVTSLLKRAVNQRKDSIEGFKKGKRDDLAEKERQEMRILEEYMPKMMEAGEIRKIAEDKKKQLSIADRSKIGILIGAVMKETKGLADGAEVKKIVESLFE